MAATVYGLRHKWMILEVRKQENATKRAWLEHREVTAETVHELSLLFEERSLLRRRARAAYHAWRKAEAKCLPAPEKE